VQAKIQPQSQIIANIINIDYKPFFITYSKPNEKRKEWKLVQLDFKTINAPPPVMPSGWQIHF
jgi:hypothetical protein